MSQPGLGAMLNYLSGGSNHDPKEYYGKKITGAMLEDSRLNIDFEGGVRIAIFDGGQSCCESRYMTTADDVTWLVGKILTAITAKDGPEVEGEYGDSHEQVFLEIGTSDGSATLANHNEHNGYYGGFDLMIEELKSDA